MDNENRANNSGQPRQWVERSRKPDWVLRSVTIITLVGWLIAMAALALYYLGAPKDNPIGDALDAIRPNIGAGGSTSAKPGLLTGTFIAILASCFACIVGFILNVTRHKRKTDRYNKLLITLSGVSLVFLVFFLINYAGTIFG